MNRDGVAAQSSRDATEGPFRLFYRHYLTEPAPSHTLAPVCLLTQDKYRTRKQDRWCCYSRQPLDGTVMVI